ncbi:hypothetical protein EGR_05988 [Echinococcus granulosus]|uniref:Uncharacterized protein n=1 Tax=Echinococcus granulosus TaxID=6210 RepID=U6ITL9_ECHGR|nr:hypothetical protein EGR_05988 [Echinococcus granulosus]EUB59125.1 hypothetical protein EGR_05988 [Echinococcus granulosus]CDS15162.1 hypothetical protein EgrG_002014200 [Echinococcus granulosus]
MFNVPASFKFEEVLMGALPHVDAHKDCRAAIVLLVLSFSMAAAPPATIEVEEIKAEPITLAAVSANLLPFENEIDFEMRHKTLDSSTGPTGPIPNLYFTAVEAVMTPNIDLDE